MSEKPEQKEKVRVVTPQELVRSHEQNVLTSLRNHSLNQTSYVHFPNKKRIPLLGQLGVWLVNRTGGIIATKYTLANDTINSNSRREKE